MIDPTENVKALSEASNRRQDDLRTAQDRLTEAKIAHLAEVVSLQAAHAREVREAETSRLDAIRQVDVSARDAAAQRAQDAIRILEATTAAMRETLRADVAITNSGINERISKLELAMSKGEGRSTGMNFGWEKLLGFVGLLGGLIGLFAYFSK